MHTGSSHDSSFARKKTQTYVSLSKQIYFTYSWKQERHRPKVSSTQQFWKLGNQLGDIEGIHDVLSNILIERVPGTPNHDLVREYIVDYMKHLNWGVEQIPFTDKTPMGQKKFTNIIARLNPNATRYLTLCCHYDSKLMEGFVGATDSAVPCAIMMNIATNLKAELQRAQNTDLSLKFIFFDGEEAFHEWNAQDSIYGARHLARKWETDDELKKIVIISNWIAKMLHLMGYTKFQMVIHFHRICLCCWIYLVHRIQRFTITSQAPKVGISTWWTLRRG